MDRVPPVSPALPVAVIGAGPVGLAAAAHLLARGETPVIFEAGAAIGAAIRDWAHVRLFSPWRYCIDEAAAALLDARDWQRPDPDHHPTGAELLRDYLEPLARTPQIAAALRLNVRVVAVARRDADKVRSRGRECQPFVVRWRDAAGRVAEGQFRAVIDASGTWTSPNPAGVSGLPAPGEVESAARLRYGIPDVHSCGSVPPHGHRELAHREKDFYIVGMKSYGRAPTFLLLTGYEQARSVAAALAGDLAAADDVHLVLPETGVCSLSADQIRDLGLAARTGDFVSAAAAATCCAPPAAEPIAAPACCGRPPPADSDASCAAGPLALTVARRSQSGAGT